MGRRVDDLSPADRDARIDVRTRLRARRIELGLSQRQLGRRLGYEAANIRRLEREGVDQSYTVTVMRWARALDMQLGLTPVGFPRPGYYYRDMVAAMVTAMATAGPGEAEDAAEVAGLVQQLVALRIACGVSQDQLAKRIGTTDKNVSLIETAGSATALVVLQRHARAIGKCAARPEAHLAVTLQPV